MRSFILACLLLLPVAASAAPAKTTPMPAFLHMSCYFFEDSQWKLKERYVAIANITGFYVQTYPARLNILSSNPNSSCDSNMSIEDFKTEMKARGVVIYENPFYLP